MLPLFIVAFVRIFKCINGTTTGKSKCLMARSFERESVLVLVCVCDYARDGRSGLSFEVNVFSLEKRNGWIWMNCLDELIYTVLTFYQLWR